MTNLYRIKFNDTYYYLDEKLNIVHDAIVLFTNEYLSKALKIKIEIIDSSKVEVGVFKILLNDSETIYSIIPYITTESKKTFVKRYLTLLGVVGKFTYQEISNKDFEYQFFKYENIYTSIFNFQHRKEKYNTHYIVYNRLEYSNKSFNLTYSKEAYKNTLQNRCEPSYIFDGKYIRIEPYIFYDTCFEELFPNFTFVDMNNVFLKEQSSCNIAYFISKNYEHGLNTFSEESRLSLEYLNTTLEFLKEGISEGIVKTESIEPIVISIILLNYKKTLEEIKNNFNDNLFFDLSKVFDLRNYHSNNAEVKKLFV